MSGSENMKDRTSDAPLTDDEFDAWWPFSDDDLDEYERELAESLRDCEWLPPLYLEGERRESRVKVRRILAEKYPNGFPGNPAPDAEAATPPSIPPILDDA